MPVRSLSLTLSVVIFAGCSTVPKSGVEARNAAHARMDQVTAAMTRSQAINAFETGQLDKARELVTGAIERHADDAESWSLLGRVLMEQLRLDEAVIALRRAVELDPSHAQSHYFLGVIHERWSKDHDALQFHLEAHRSDPARPQYLMAAAEAHLAVGDTMGARSLVEARLDRFEHNPAMQHLLAHIATLEGDTATAAARCEEARLLAPDDESIARDLCRMRFGNGDWAGCIDAVEDWSNRFGTTDATLDRLRARCLVLVHRHNEARGSYRNLCEADPEDVSLWRERGLLAWTQQDWDTLQLCADQLAHLRPETYEAALFQAVVHRASGQLEAAKNLLEWLVEADPERAEAWTVLASVRAALGDLHGAAKARDIAVKWAPDLADDPRVTGVFGSDGS